jgi:hypothetical protein
MNRVLGLQNLPEENTSPFMTAALSTGSSSSQCCNKTRVA